MVVQVSATDKLEKLLKERGTRYKIIERKGKGTLAGALWRYPTGNGTGYYVAQAVRYGDILTCRLHLTPEQAVEATLRRETCTNVHEPPKNTTFWPAPHFQCSVCGEKHVSIDYVYYCPNCGRKVVD